MQVQTHIYCCRCDLKKSKNTSQRFVGAWMDQNLKKNSRDRFWKLGRLCEVPSEDSPTCTSPSSPEVSEEAPLPCAQVCSPGQPVHPIKAGTLVLPCVLSHLHVQPLFIFWCWYCTSYTCSGISYNLCPSLPTSLALTFLPLSNSSPNHVCLSLHCHSNSLFKN